MMTKLSKSTVSLVVLALAAGTALHFHSGFLQEADKESSSSPELAQQQQRELAHGETIQHPARGELYHRVYRALGKVEGLKPESPKFNQLLHDEVERRKGLHRENGRRDKVNQRNRKVTEERRNMEDTLRDSDEIWLRGDYLLSSGSWRANTWDRGQEVKAAAEAAGEFKVSCMLGSCMLGSYYCHVDGYFANQYVVQFISLAYLLGLDARGTTR